MIVTFTTAGMLFFAPVFGEKRYDFTSFREAEKIILDGKILSKGVYKDEHTLLVKYKKKLYYCRVGDLYAFLSCRYVK